MALMQPTRFLVALAVLTVAADAVVQPADTAKAGVDWPSFRGIHGAGTAEGFTTATSWNVPEKKGVE